MSRQFKNIELFDWRQFGRVVVPLDRQFTVLTGPNGCGKTTVLNTLSRHFGWNINLISTPFLSKKTRERLWSEFGRDWIDAEGAADIRKVGEIEYSTGEKCTLHVPATAHRRPQYQLQYQGQQPVVGLHVPSHRPSITYQRIAEIPTDPQAAHQHFSQFNQLLLQSYSAPKSQNPGLVLKKSLISLAVFGPGNKSVRPNPHYAELFEGFEQVLLQLLPPELGFQRLEIQMPDVVLVTETGPFALDSMSGGISALFGIAWQIFMHGADKDQCTVVFDEPENHLHPSMQRTLLPRLGEAFPTYRFIIATHSPFIVTSHPDASVVALTFDSQKRIRSELLRESELAGSPNRVLREILDVPTTIPVWVEQRIKGIFAKYEDEPDAELRAKQIFDALKEDGLNSALSYFDPTGDADE